MKSFKQVRLNKKNFETFKKILELRKNIQFKTDNGALKYFLDNYQELLYPDFEKYFNIETKIDASLSLSAHQANHFINLQIKELNFLANCINILYLDFVNSEEKVQEIIEKESGLKRMIAYQYDLEKRRDEKL